MQPAESNNFQEQVLEHLDRIHTDLGQLHGEVGQLKQELALTNTRIDTYQKASSQVVNLAFGLIATATVTIIASVVLK